MPSILNIAVIGAGSMAQTVHLPLLRRRWDRFAVTALVDHSPRRRREGAEAFGIAEEIRYERVADLVTAVRKKEVQVDGAVLATDGLHVEDVLALMRRGIPVLVEPPLGFSEEEIARVADMERMMGRRLVMMAYPQQYDEVVESVSEQVRVRDVRMIDHEVLMPAAAPLFGHAHVTAAAYDLPAAERSERRQALQDAVVAGAGGGATQRDRDLYVKGLLTGVAHQMAVTERIFGPIARLVAVRHWPKGVIPGSVEILGELEGGEPVRLVWHYLPFAPQYSETFELLTARKRVDIDLAPVSILDRRSRISVLEKSHGRVETISHSSALGAAESMWEAFHDMIAKGSQPISGAEEALAQVCLLREVLAAIVEADGRSLEPEEPEEDQPAAAAEPEGIEVEASADADSATAPDSSGAPGSSAAPRAPIETVAPADPADPAAPAEPAALIQADAPLPVDAPIEPDAAVGALTPVAPAAESVPAGEPVPLEEEVVDRGALFQPLREAAEAHRDEPWAYDPERDAALAEDAPASAPEGEGIDPSRDARDA